MKGYMYILQCSDGKFYTGYTRFLERRLQQHQNGEGANFTKKRLPVRLVYYEEYPRSNLAFFREKQIQGWSHSKKLALINKQNSRLPLLSSSSAALRELGKCIYIPDPDPASTRIANKRTKLYGEARRRYKVFKPRVKKSPPQKQH
jgi:putative endonuclease